ncbi:fibrinogen-like protein 1-like protein [Emydura macquarii macquarii]|uniref:fibrinogen-like protein 1-like protein n=1 Tax=Emydura macquarii macquarii TaxID=1129001 RepID=UPI00352B645C
MKLYLALCLCFLVTFTEAKDKIPLTREQLLSKVGNQDMLKGKENSVLNVQSEPVYEEYIARDCRAAYLNGRRQSGLYVVRPKNSSLIVVYCEMSQAAGGWTVLMRNTVSQKTAWARSWTAYKNGFGELEGNHWLGNEFIHLLTRQNAFAVRFVLVTADNKTIHADYHSFELDSEANGYALRLGDHSGDAGDALTVMYETGIHDNMKFSTSDRDQDRRVPDNCAIRHGGGWWYDNCRSAVLSSDQGIYWKDVCVLNSNPCQSAYVKIRPNGKNCIKHMKI